MVPPGILPVSPLLAIGIASTLVVFLLVGVGVVVLLWALVDSESKAERSEHPDWESAERAARRDTPDDGERRDATSDSGRRDESDGWGTRDDDR